MRYLLFLITSPLFAITCTPLNWPAYVVQGITFQPAVVNGIDHVSYSQARIEWISDANVTAVNYQRVVYATDAQWIANGGFILAGTVGTNYSIYQPAPGSITSATQVQGALIPNLLSSTLYHVAGQSSGDSGSTFCPAVENTFTTLAYTGIISPTLPDTFSFSVPTITGTDRTVGVTSGCPDFQSCLNISLPGDGIGIRPAFPVQSAVAFIIPNSPNAIPITAIDTTGDKFTVTALGPITNGLTVHVGVSGDYPVPLAGGVTFSVLNVNTGAKTFQLSLDGINPLDITTVGGAVMYVIPWPIIQDPILIHSTCSTSLLPPDEIRLDPIAYAACLGKIQLTTPCYGCTNELFDFKPMSIGYYMKDLEFDMLPFNTTGQTDPYPYGQFFTMPPATNGNIFDQVYFHGPPAPDRIALAASWGGTNHAIVNSYFDNEATWSMVHDPFNATIGSNTIQIPAHTYTYAVTGNIKAQCVQASPATLTLTSGTGAIFIYWTINPCALTAQLQTGLTATGPFTITTAASPFFPLSAPTLDGSGVATGLNIGSGNYNGSSVSFGVFNMDGLTRFHLPNDGIQLFGGPGPFRFENNYFAGQQIFPIYWDQYIGNTCFGGVCVPQYNVANLTAKRNTAMIDPHYIPGNALYNGSWWWGRNGWEMKEGGRLLYDGNIIGPVLGGIAPGECWLLENAYSTIFTTDAPSVQNTADITLTNNTCLNGGGITLGGSSPGYNPAIGMQRVNISNNLFYFNNAFNQNPNPTQSASQGRGIWLDATESVKIDHNTWRLAAGYSAPGGPSLQFHLGGGTQITNNIFSYNTDFSFTSGFTYGNPLNSAPQPAGSTQGTALLAYLNNVTWANNLYLCQWSDSVSQIDMTSGACSSAAALYPGNTFFPNSGSTLVSRTAAIHWYDSSTKNLRLNYLSPYISGGTSHGTDYKDIGADINALEAAQGNVSNVHTYNTTSTSTIVAFLAPDSYGCTVDYGTANFPSGTGSWTRISNAGGTRIQNVNITGLTTGITYIYRVNCVVMQPTGTFTTR